MILGLILSGNVSLGLKISDEFIYKYGARHLFINSARHFIYI